MNGWKPAGAVVAGSTVVIISTILFKEYAVAGYICTFAGISSTTVIPSILHVSVFGSIAGIFTLPMAKLFVGYSGKAGTTCFCTMDVVA
ncbi:MAG: hypothetical protein QXI32_00040 [Candidatus Bathyarchaeia archaeon]